MILRKFKIEDMKGEWLEGSLCEVDEKVWDRCINFTAIDEEDVVACGGIILDSDPVFWMTVKKKVKRPIAFVKAIQEVIRSILTNTTTGKAITYIRDGFKQAEKLDKLLGFTPTGEQTTINDIIYNRYEICLG